MGFFQNLKDDLTSTIDDIAIKEEQGAAPSDTQSLLDILKSDEFTSAIEAVDDASSDAESDDLSSSDIEQELIDIDSEEASIDIGAEDIKAIDEAIDEAIDKNLVDDEVVAGKADDFEETVAAEVEETEEIDNIEEKIEEVESEESLDVLAEVSLDDTLGDIMSSAEEATKESSVRDALNSLRNASLRYEQQLKNQETEEMSNEDEAVSFDQIDGMFLLADSDPVSEDQIEEVSSVSETEEVLEIEEASETEEVSENNTAVDEAEEVAYSPVIDEPYKGVSEEVAVIATGMVINGDVSSDGNMELLGTINGNISIAGKLSVSGKVSGNIKANDIFVDGAELEGNIETAESAKIGNGSVIIGNIKSAAAIVAGAVKGDIDVKGPVILDSSAIIMGNIKSMSVQINNGAVVEGMCSQCYAEVNPTDFFKEFEK